MRRTWPRIWPCMSKCTGASAVAMQSCAWKTVIGKGGAKSEFSDMHAQQAGEIHFARKTCS